MIARKDGDDVHLWTRGGADYAGAMTKIAAALRRVAAPRFVIDGEAVVFRAGRSCDFFALRSQEGQAAAVLIAFDLLELEGTDLRRLPLEERRARLVKLLRKPPAGITLSEIFDQIGETVFRHACRLGVESIISKRRGSAYTSGRSDSWRKTLCPDYRRS